MANRLFEAATPPLNSSVTSLLIADGRHRQHRVGTGPLSVNVADRPEAVVRMDINLAHLPLGSDYAEGQDATHFSNCTEALKAFLSSLL